MFRAMFLEKTGRDWFEVIAEDWEGSSEYSRIRWLHTEVYHGHALGVAYLLSLGANPNYESPSPGYSMLTTACMKGHVKIVRMLIANGANLEWPSVENMTPLMWAAKEGHAEVVRLLLAAGADKEARDIERWTPLVYACRYGKLEAARVLLEAGADVHVRVDEDWTPLRKAIEGNWEKVVALLLEHGADYDERYNNVFHYNTTVLMEAVLDRSYGSVQHLIAAGANVNAVDDTGSTALFYVDVASAAMRRIIRRLFEAGIDGTIRDKEGKTALDRAEGQKNPWLSDMLVKEMSRAREREQRAK
jgi:ankyrin repeat protein